MDWIDLAQDRDRWQTPVNTGSMEWEAFLDYMRTC
jgi:hypothetical protein